MFEFRVELEVSILIDCIFDSREDSETSNFSVITFLPHLSDISPYRNAPVPVVIPIERALSHVTCHERKRRPAYLFVFVQTESHLALTNGRAHAHGRGIPYPLNF